MTSGAGGDPAEEAAPSLDAPAEASTGHEVPAVLKEGEGDAALAIARAILQLSSRSQEGSRLGLGASPLANVSAEGSGGEVSTGENLPGDFIADKVSAGEGLAREPSSADEDLRSLLAARLMAEDEDAARAVVQTERILRQRSLDDLRLEARLLSDGEPADFEPPPEVLAEPEPLEPNAKGVKGLLGLPFGGFGAHGGAKLGTGLFGGKGGRTFGPTGLPSFGSESSAGMHGAPISPSSSGSEPEVVARARYAQALAVERARAVSENRAPGAPVHLSIPLDESGLRLRISPRGDGTHELALLVADPRLRQELERGRRELELALKDLPIAIIELVIGIDPDRGDMHAEGDIE